SASTVTGTGTDTAVGGLVGANGGIGFLTSGQITNSSATGNVFASNGAVAGGFVGQNSEGATISNSSASGAVTLTGSSFVNQIGGGFVGENEGQITDSHSTGAVSGSGGLLWLGGFAGRNDPGGVITNSDTIGNVSVNGATFAL